MNVDGETARRGAQPELSLVRARTTQAVRAVVRRIRATRRPRWWEELLFIAASYLLYSLVRNNVPMHRSVAFTNARRVLEFERHTHLDAETPFNHFLARHEVLAYTASYWYALLHFVVTIAVLAWLYARHPLNYRALRTVLYVANVVALFGFWLFPLAPPRMLDGFVDVVDRFPTLWISWDSGSVATISNQFAAMPSLHIAWSMWCGVVLWRLGARRWVRVIAVFYPLTTLFVILGTANHFLLDAFGGVLALSAALAYSRSLFGRRLTAAPGVAVAAEREQFATIAA